MKDSNIVINIKQTLRHARDVIEAAEGLGEIPLGEKTPDQYGPHDTPSKEWIAEERAKLTAGLRFVILKRDGYRCQLCGASATEANYVRLEVDHRTPVTAWGRTVEANLWTLCRACNKGKSNRPAT
jgi:5-methylcytosine-specific restriction endonuclease McrA